MFLCNLLGLFVLLVKFIILDNCLLYFVGKVFLNSFIFLIVLVLKVEKKLKKWFILYIVILLNNMRFWFGVLFCMNSFEEFLLFLLILGSNWRDWKIFILFIFGNKVSWVGDNCIVLIFFEVFIILNDLFDIIIFFRIILEDSLMIKFLILVVFVLIWILMGV